MSPAIAQRTVIKANPKGEEADPIFEVEDYDVDTGERVARWKPEPSNAAGDFTIPGPEYRCVGLQPQYGPGRRGRYLSPMQLEGRAW